MKAAALVRRGIVQGVDLNELARRFWRLEAMSVDDACRVPELQWRAFKRGGVWGRAIGSWHVRISISPSASFARIAELLLHELVHCSCPKRNHDELFCRRLIACAREAFHIDLDTDALLALDRGAHACRAYAIDEAIVARIQGTITAMRCREDAGLRYDEPVPEAHEARLARLDAERAKRAAAREAHARKMLATWERQLKTAKQRATHWRTRVRYYDKRAARPRKDGDT